MLDHAQLHALLTIERETGFVRAADRLGLSRSALSDRIKALEEQVGVVLVRRTRPIEMTEVGAMLCRHAEAIEQREFDILRAFSVDAAIHQRTSAKLRVLIDADSVATWFADVLREEAELDDPRLFELSFADRDRSLEAMKQGYALTAVSGRAEPIHGYKSRSLGRHVYRAVASATFVQRYLPIGVGADALARLPCIGRDACDDVHREWLEIAFGEAAHVPTHVIPSTWDAIAACRSGLGWMIAPEPLVREAIASGELVDLRPIAPLEKPLYWHVSLLAEAAVQSLSRRVVATAQRYLAQSSKEDSPAKARRSS